MKLVVFGLTITSSWGNGHATLWRGLSRALAARGHHVTFFERDTPYYAGHRDAPEPQGAAVVLYEEWEHALARARRELLDADVAMVTSYCADAVAASAELLDAGGIKVFYDLDTPVTLAGLRTGRPVPYIGLRGLRDFDLVLSYTGGTALAELEGTLGARRVVPLYGHVDPDVHRPTPRVPHFQSDLSYLGTYSEDRQAALQELLLEPARRAPERRFYLAGAQYPDSFPWSANIYFARHLTPAEHPAFFCSSRLTLNVTRREMAQMGYCPSGRLFEAAACGVPMVSDVWTGLENFFQPGDEIVAAHRADDTLDALELSDAELTRIGRRARERTLSEHTAARRALELESALAACCAAPAAAQGGA
jgi:spore maturation protein CgeB